MKQTFLKIHYSQTSMQRCTLLIAEQTDEANKKLENTQDNNTWINNLHALEESLIAFPRKPGDKTGKVESSNCWKQSMSKDTT